METHVALLGPIGEKVVAQMNDRYRQKLKYRKHHPAEIIVICGEHAYRWGPDGVFEEIEL